MKHFFLVINLLLITAAVFFSVKTFYKVITARFDYIHLPRTFHKDEAIPKKETYLPLSYYNTIVERDLFKIKTEKNEATVRIETLEHTDLDMKLWGTVIGNIDSSYAVIEETKGNRRQREHNIYHVGDVVQSATIKKILREKVILSINGKDEILEMEEHCSSLRKRKRYTRPITQKRILHRAQIEKSVKDVNKLITQARIRPHSEGLHITHIKPNSIFRKLGLLNGDIITGVDGRRIESVDDALSLYRNLQSSSRVTLELKRRGRPRTINYTIR